MCSKIYLPLLFYFVLYNQFLNHTVNNLPKILIKKALHQLPQASAKQILASSDLFIVPLIARTPFENTSHFLMVSLTHIPSIHTMSASNHHLESASLLLGVVFIPIE